MLNILICSPHIDDGVLGCGGAILKLSQTEDTNIDYLVFSPKSHEYSNDVLHQELVNSLNHLGLDDSCIRYLNFETRYFVRDRQEILDSLYDNSKEVDYDWIFTPSLFDVHQDHETVTNELLRIYKRLPVSIFGYELILNQFSFSTAVFFGFDDQVMDAKIKAFNCFQSQMFRKHFSSDLFRSAAKVRGAQMGAEYAEAFQAIRVIINKQRT